MNTILTNIIDQNGSLSKVFLSVNDSSVCDICFNWNGDYIDYSDSILSPFFFNIHCHLGESCYPLDDRVEWDICRYIQYTEKINAGLSEEAQQSLWERSAQYTAQEQVKNGISGICAARAHNVCSRYNLNCMTGYPIMNSSKLRSYKEKGERGFLDFYRARNGTCSVGVFFHSLYLNDDKSLRLANLCINNGAEFLTVHISEDAKTRELELQALGKEPTKVLDDYGLLNSKTILVHGGFLSEEELQLVRDREATIAICPISNKTLNTHLPNIKLIRELGINWCVATDGFATGKSFSLFDQIKELRESYPMISSRELYNACTVNCGKLFCRPIYTGLVSVGSEARFLRYQFDETKHLYDELLMCENIIDKIEL